MRLEPFAFFLACTNGLTFEDTRVRKCHVGRKVGDADFPEEFLRDETRDADDHVFWMKVRDVLAGVLDESFLDRKLERLRAASGEPIQAEPEKVVEVTARRFRFTDNEKDSVLSHFLAG